MPARFSSARRRTASPRPCSLRTPGRSRLSRAWAQRCAVRSQCIDAAHVHVSAPLVGRETELELLQHTYDRRVRDGRAHLFTIYGEPGVGKSRLVREFVDSVDGASVLKGRCLPYGESVTYWPLAEMMKSAVGITDDEPLEEAFEKLRACCEDDAVADLIGLASGLLEAVEGERSPQEIAWAAREVMSTLADVQPLILFFEDIHWAEEPMFDLVEHLADWVRAPLAHPLSGATGPARRPAGLGRRPGAVDSDRARAVVRGGEPGARRRARLRPDGSSAAAEGLLDNGGQPLFVEETIRMLVEGGDSTASPTRCRRSSQPVSTTCRPMPRCCCSGRRSSAACSGRGDRTRRSESRRGGAARRSAAARVRPPRGALLDLGETAFRFRHMLIREVAYAGLSKRLGAQQHARFAEWLKERAGDELVEIRAHHLDHATQLLAELDGAAPAELRAGGGQAR